MLCISRNRDDSREQRKCSAGFVLHRPESRLQRRPSEFNRLLLYTLENGHADYEGMRELQSFSFEDAVTAGFSKNRVANSSEIKRDRLRISMTSYVSQWSIIVESYVFSSE